MDGRAGEEGELIVEILPSSKEARDIITNYPRTTGYSGEGTQQAYERAMNGRIRLSHNGETIGRARIVDGSAVVSLDELPMIGDAVEIHFSGDPSSSYQVNYRSSTTRSRIKKLEDYAGAQFTLPGSHDLTQESSMLITSSLSQTSRSPTSIAEVFDL